MTTANAGWATASARAPLVGALASESAVLLPDVDARLEVFEGSDAVDREGTEGDTRVRVVAGTRVECVPVGEDESLTTVVVTVVETSVV